MMAEKSHDSIEQKRASTGGMLVELVVLLVAATWASAKLSLQWGVAGWVAVALLQWLQTRVTRRRTGWLALVKFGWPIGLGARTSDDIRNSWTTHAPSALARR